MGRTDHLRSRVLHLVLVILPLLCLPRRRRRLAGAERRSRGSQTLLKHLCGRVPASENAPRAIVLDISEARSSSYSSRFITMLDAKLVSNVADAATARHTTRASMASLRGLRRQVAP